MKVKVIAPGFFNGKEGELKGVLPDGRVQVYMGPSKTKLCTFMDTGVSGMPKPKEPEKKKDAESS